MIKYFITILILSFTVSVLAQGIEEKTGFGNIHVSNDASRLLFSHDEQRGFYMLDLITNKNILIEENKFSAYQASISDNGDLIAYKKFVETENTRLQQPILYDVQTGKSIELFKPVRHCGTPSIISSGNIVFTIGRELYVTTKIGEIIHTFELPSYSNLTPVSPDGKNAVYNDNEDKLWILNLETSEKERISPKGQGFFEPHWSPDGHKIVANSLAGELSVFNKNDASVIYIGSGKHPEWTDDSKKIIYSKAEVLENREVLNQDLYIFDIESNSEVKLTDSNEREVFPALAGNKLYYSSLNSGLLFESDVTISKNTYEIHTRSKINPVLYSIPAGSTTPNLKKKDPTSAVYFDIPYVNQRYDTPDWFNGNWACGATAAIQCISYFGLVQQWPVWVSTPYPHISDYGNYICEIYSYNGTTFNIGGRDPNGTIGYGGYGYIIKNDWANTKDYMRDYAIIHGLGSAVDWSPTRGKVIAEVQNEDPFVLLNSLTTSGHYISVIGYDDINATTVIVNDPYGNKNNGYANFYGRRSYYDWPGYNNGYENLNTVHCYIYFRGHPPADIAVHNFIINTDTSVLSQKVYFSAEISNIGNMSSIATNAELFISDAGIYDETVQVLSTIALPALTVGQTFVIQDSVIMQDSIISGDYKLSVFADSDTINNEMLKYNNVLTTDIVLHGYPRIYAIIPENSSIISNTKPEIRVKFQDRICGIDMANIKLYLNNNEITDSCSFGSREISYIPGYDLSDGVYFCRTEIPNFSGFTVKYSWNFEIQQVSGIDKSEFNPNKFYLSQNYPNPFNPNTIIGFNLPNAGFITLKIFDIKGNLVSEIVNHEFYTAGYQKIQFNAESLASGVYFYTLLSAGRESITKKMLLLR